MCKKKFWEKAIFKKTTRNKIKLFVVLNTICSFNYALAVRKINTKIHHRCMCGNFV